MSTLILGQDTFVKHQSTYASLYYEHMRTHSAPGDELVSKNLRYLMNTREMSERALGLKADVAQKTVNKILNRDSSPTLRTLRRLADALGVEVTALISKNLDPQATPQSLPELRRTAPSHSDSSAAPSAALDRQMLVDAVTAAVTTAASQRMSLTPAQMGEYAALIYEMWSDAPNKAARVRPERLLRLVSSR